MLCFRGSTPLSKQFYSSDAAFSACFAAQTLFKVIWKKEIKIILNSCSGFCCILPFLSSPTPRNEMFICIWQHLTIGFKEETCLEFKWKHVLSFCPVQLQFSVFRHFFQTSAFSNFLVLSLRNWNRPFLVTLGHNLGPGLDAWSIVMGIEWFPHFNCCLRSWYVEWAISQLDRNLSAVLDGLSFNLLLTVCSLKLEFFHIVWT